MTLLSCITGGEDWREQEQTLADVGLSYQLCFIFYILFLTVCVLNILVGIYVDAAFEARAGDKLGQMLAELDKTAVADNKLAKIFQVLAGCLASDQSGSISKAEF